MVDEGKPGDSSGTSTRGIFSDADREYLRGDKEYEHRQSKHKREQAIRRRFYNALKDMRFLGEQVDREDRQQILDLNDPEERYEIDLGLGWMIALAHRLAVDIRNDFWLDPRIQAHKCQSFEARLQEGLEQAYLDEGAVLEDVVLQVESKEVPGLAELQDRVAHGGQVPTQAIDYLIDTDEIDERAFFEFLAAELDVDLKHDEDADE